MSNYKDRISLWLMTVVFGLVSAQALAQGTVSSEQLQQQLIERIATSQAALSKTQGEISAERRRLGAELQAQEQAVIALRDKAASSRRTKDEALLGLDQLQVRLESWQRQSSYQQHLLNSYRDEFGQPAGQVAAEAMSLSQVLRQSIGRVKSFTQPVWQKQAVVLTDGEVKTVETLDLGPVITGYDQAGAWAALLEVQASGDLGVARLYPDDSRRGIEKLFQTGLGFIEFDPTLGSAKKIAGQRGGILNHLYKGGVWAIPIVFFGFLSLLIAVAKALQLMRLPSVDVSLPEKINYILSQPKDQAQAGFSEIKECADGAQRRLLEIALKHPVSQVRDDLLVAYLMEYRYKIERYMGVVTTSAAISPLLGLLGTVSGMISTFKMMTIFGSGDASTVSGGISEALVTTELGLVVAIPSLIMSALLNRKAKNYAHKLEAFAIKISKIQFSLKAKNAATSPESVG